MYDVVRYKYRIERKASDIYPYNQQDQQDLTYIYVSNFELRGSITFVSLIVLYH